MTEICIAVDAMGGDYAPSPVVEGAVAVSLLMILSAVLVLGLVRWFGSESYIR